MVFSFDIVVQQLIKGILYEGGVFIGSILFGAGTTIGIAGVMRLLKFSHSIQIEITNTRSSNSSQ